MLYVLNINSIFKKNDLYIGFSGRKFLKVGALPTKNLPVKSFQKPLKPERLTIVKHPLPIPIVHREFGCVRKSIEKHFWGKDGSDWNFSFYVDEVCDEVLL